MSTTAQLLEKKCRHQKTALSETETASYLAAINGWSYQEGQIVKTFSFQNFHETMAFINAVAYIMHSEDHHPELIVHYNRCTIRSNTHSVNNRQGGLSENDFICAAKIDVIFTQSLALTTLNQ
jgi:4a-hydroxytetrahydrobiopterin dehydratase